jgi:predicted O-methyltransferase YrrM
MEPAVERILREFEKRDAEEWERRLQMDRANQKWNVDDFLLSVGPATGQLINLLAKETKAQTILEVGSSYGYSTVWLAEAARVTGGKVISLEIHPEKQKQARASIKEAGLDQFLDFRLGDARDLLAKLDDSADFVLLDLWKDLYIPCFDLFYPKLRCGALVIADNMIQPESSRKDAEAYRRHVRARSDMESVMLPVGSGIELSRRS